MDVTFVFSGIILLFASLLLVKRVTSLRFCVMCVSVSITWVSLLVLYKIQLFDDVVLIALLIGQSIIGLYYLAEKHLPERYMVFRVAGLLTMTFIAYAVLAQFEWYTFALLSALWFVSGFLYAYRGSPKLKSTVDHIIACCRDW